MREHTPAVSLLQEHGSAPRTGVLERQRQGGGGSSGGPQGYLLPSTKDESEGSPERTDTEVFLPVPPSTLRFAGVCTMRVPRASLCREGVGWKPGHLRTPVCGGSSCAAGHPGWQWQPPASRGSSGLSEPPPLVPQSTSNTQGGVSGHWGGGRWGSWVEKELCGHFLAPAVIYSTLRWEPQLLLRTGCVLPKCLC